MKINENAFAVALNKLNTGIVPIGLAQTREILDHVLEMLADKWEMDEEMAVIELILRHGQRYSKSGKREKRITKERAQHFN